jgi:uncharacterized membrane protein
MADTGTETTAADYLSAVRAELADLPPTEVGEILDDIGPHVAEVATELGPEGQPAALHDRLGTPQRYAAELRAAAGYPAAAPPVPPRPTATHNRPRLALALLVVAVVVLPLTALANGDEDEFAPLVLLAAALAGLSLLLVRRAQDGVASVAAMPEVTWLRERNPGGLVEEYARLFQPGWWLVRAGIVATGLVYLGRGGLLTVLLLTVPLALVSMWVGRRSQADRRWLWAVLPANAFVAAFGLVVAGTGTAWAVGGGGDSGYYQIGDVGPSFGNIYPYDSTGRPLTGVYLYDETGRPITLGNRYDECQPNSRLPVPANRYPLPEYEWDVDDGECVLRSVVPTPAELPPSATTGAPTAAPTAGPTGGTTAPGPGGGAPPAPTTPPVQGAPPTPTG